MSQERINKQIDNLLLMQTLADEAKRLGFDKDATFKARVEQFQEKLLTETVLQRLDEEASREFEQKRASFLERAREQYLVNKAHYQTPKEVRVSHVLVEAKSRSSEEALAKIKAIRERAVAGEPFDKLAETMSDDTSARTNKGDLGFFGTGRMDPAFEAAAFALTKPKEISEPIRSAFGWHIIRLEEMKPIRQLTFEEASYELMEKLKTQYSSTRQQQYMAQLYDRSKVKWNEAAVVGLKKTVDPSVYKLPEQLR